MNDDQQGREEEIFVRALELAPGKERAAWLDEACGGDLDLRRSVEQLLVAHAEPASLLGDTEPGSAASNAVKPGGEKPGDRFGTRYELIEEIGRGGMGTVWLAEQCEPVRRKVALKIIKLGMDTREVVARFEAERQALAMMDHPGIAKVYDAGVTEQGRPFFVMELVEGQPLTRYCDERRLGTKQRLALFIEICRAVQHAHQKGVVHRDIKPTNILVAEQDGRPVAKVIDFGIAKAVEEKLTAQTLMTGLGRVIGTLGYMSPEQAGGEQDIDTRSDIYSLGVVLYELLAGVAPFGPDRFREAVFDATLKMIREEEPPKPSTRVSRLGETGTEVAQCRSTEIHKLARTMSGDLDWIVMRALEKNRDRRYETANAFARDLECYLNDEAVAAGQPSASYRMRKFVRRNRVAISLSTILLLMPLFLTIVTFWVARLEITRNVNSHLESVGDLQHLLIQNALYRDFERLEQVSSLRPLQEYVTRFLNDSAEDSQDRVNRILGDARDAVEGVTEICIIDPAGKVIGSSNLDNLGEIDADEAFIRERERFKDRIERQDGRAVSFGVEDGVLRVVLSEPFKSEDGVLGLIVIRTNGENLTATMLGGEPVRTLLVKREIDGTVIVLAPPEVAGPLADAPDDGPLSMAANNHVGFLPAARDEFCDERVLAVTRHFGGVVGDLGFVSQIDRSVAYRGLAKVGLASLVILVISLVVGGGILTQILKRPGSGPRP